MKKTIIGILSFAVVAVIIYTFICYAWIGAEYQIEKAVHFGKVDALVVAFITGVICNWLFSPRKDCSDAKN